MTRTGRKSLFLLIVGVFFVFFSLAAGATEEQNESPAETTTSTVDSGISPAVTIGEDEAPAAQVDWTYRYIIPTGLVIAAVIVLFTAIKYFTDVVRKRYRILD